MNVQDEVCQWTGTTNLISTLSKLRNWLWLRFLITLCGKSETALGFYSLGSHHQLLALLIMDSFSWFPRYCVSSFSSSSRDFFLPMPNLLGSLDPCPWPCPFSPPYSLLGDLASLLTSFPSAEPGFPPWELHTVSFLGHRPGRASCLQHHRVP